MYRIILIIGAFIFVSTTSNGQDDLLDWFHDDPSTGYVGVSTEKTYNELLKNRSSRTVIVAIIDSGIDVEHEDLIDNANFFIV